MLRWIIGTSVKFRLLVVALAAGLLALGVIQLSSARVDALPEFSPPYIEVQTEALGLSAAEVEQLITVPLEADLLNGVGFLQEIRSDSVPGLSSIVMIFEPGTQLTRARQLVAERMTQAHALPHVSKPPVMLEPTSSASRVMVIGMSAKDASLIQQSVLARWTIRPKLMGVPGVANVSVFGQRERQLQVLVDPAQLASRNVNLRDVLKTAGNAMWFSPLTFLEASTPGTGGFIDTPNQRLSVQNVSPITNADSLKQVGVTDHPGLLLGDVARVVEDHQPLIGDAVTGDKSGLMLVVEKHPDANTLEVTRGVEAALRELAPGLGGVSLDSTVYRPASFTEMAMSNLGLTLLIGLVLAVLLIGLFLYSWRVAVIALVTIPVSVVTAGLLLSLFGYQLNLLVVAGLVAALAVIIDDAVSDGENIERRVREQREGAGGTQSSAGVVLRGSLQMRSSLAYATLITGLAVAPVLFIAGSRGEFVAPLVVAYLVALLAATLVALIVTPALSLFLLSRSEPGPQSPPARWLQGRYDRHVAPSVQRWRPAVVVAVILVALGAATAPLLSTSLLPTLREPDVLIQFDGAAGTSRPEMSRIMAAASTELRGVAGVRDVGGHVGRALLSDQVADVNTGEIWVRIDPSADYDATLAAVQEVVNGYPGLERGVRTYLSDRSATLLAGPASDVIVRIYGESDAVRAGKADEVRQLLSGIGGVVNPQVLRRPDQPTLQIEVDLAAAQRVNLNPGDVRRFTATLLSGLEVGSLFEQQKVFEVVVRGAPEIRDSVTDVQNLLIETSSGARVRLGDVATVRVVPAPAVIERNAVSRYTDVVASVSGRNAADVTADVRAQLRTIQFPFEHRAEVVSGTGTGPDATGLIVGAAVVAVIGALLLLQAAFGSWRLAGLAFLTLPVALAGGAIGALAGGGVVSLGSLAGLAVVLAIAVRHTVTLIGHYQRLAASAVAVGPELVRRGTRERLVPILTSVLAIALAFLPFVVAGARPGLELIRPMAMVVLGGLVTATIVNLWLLPAVYAAVARRTEPDTDVVIPTQRSDELVPSTPTTSGRS